MSGRLVFHGSFTSKRKARRKQRGGPNRFVVIRTVNGRRYYRIVSRRAESAGHRSETPQ